MRKIGDTLQLVAKFFLYLIYQNFSFSFNKKLQIVKKKELENFTESKSTKTFLYLLFKFLSKICLAKVVIRTVIKNTSVT